MLIKTLGSQRTGLNWRNLSKVFKCFIHKKKKSHSISLCLLGCMEVGWALGMKRIVWEGRVSEDNNLQHCRDRTKGGVALSSLLASCLPRVPTLKSWGKGMEDDGVDSTSSLTLWILILEPYSDLSISCLQRIFKTEYSANRGRGPLGLWIVFPEMDT